MLRTLRLPAGALATTLLLGVVGAVRTPVSAQTPPATPTPAAGAAGQAGADEALLSILPYRLRNAELPAGFQILGQEARTPAKRAFDLGDTNADSQDALRTLQRGGFQAGFEQVIGPNNNTPVRVAALDVELFSSDLKASAAFHDSLDVPETERIQSDNPPLSARFGEESGAVHVIVTDAEGLTTAFEGIVWRRKALLFTLLLVTVDGTESIEQALPFAQAADRHATAVTLPATAAPASLPVVSADTYQIDAMYALYVRLPGADQAPLGFRAGARSVIATADLLLDADNPRAAFDRINGRWKRVAAVERIFGTLQGPDGDQLHVQLALSADAAGAAANLLDAEHEPGSSVEVFGLPTPLGDDSRLYHETYTHADGVPREAWRAVWTRGRVVLSAFSTGPAGDFSAQQVSAFAVVVDATYQKGAQPDVLTTRTPGAPVAALRAE